MSVNEQIIEALQSLLSGRGSYKEEEHYKFMEEIINKKIKKLRGNNIRQTN